MDRKSKIKKFSTSGLVFLLIFFSEMLNAQTFDLGVVTKVEGEVSFLEFSPPHRLSQTQKDSQLQSGGSYLAKDDSFMTVKIFDESFLRLNPKSKISLEYDPASKELKIFLFNGSLKAILGQSPKSRLEKMIIQSGGSQFESTAAKFTVSRNLIKDSSSVYVEKGIVIANVYHREQKKDSEIIYQNETTTISDNDLEISSAKTMKEKEIKFLHPSNYLPKKNKIMR